MLRLRNVLFPTDFSDFSFKALPLALALAVEHESDLHMIHRSDGSAGEDRQIQSRRELLSSRVAGLLPDGVAFEPIIEAEDGIAAAPVIVECIKDRRADLVIMTTHGYQGLKRDLMGSVAEEVVRNSGCPVLTVRDTPEIDMEAGFMPASVVVPIDFSTWSIQCLKYAKNWADYYNARLHLVHVVGSPDVPSPYGEDITAFRSSQNEAFLSRSHNALQELAESHQLEKYELTVLNGKPWESLCDYMVEIDASLAIMATRGLSESERRFIGSTAENVVREAPCPVITLKAGIKLPNY